MPTSSPGEERVATDVDGRFGIGRVPAHDEVVVEVRALEYPPQRIVLEPVADMAIDVSLTPDPVGRRLIAAKVAEIDHRSLHSPFGRRLVPREDVVLKASWTAAELVQDRMYLRRSIGCLIVDEQQVMIPRWSTCGPSRRRCITSRSSPIKEP